jgi:hypothetical protein
MSQRIPTQHDNFKKTQSQKPVITCLVFLARSPPNPPHHPESILDPTMTHVLDINSHVIQMAHE